MDGGVGAAMGVKQWVCHISGQGEKWRVSEEKRPAWMAEGHRVTDREWLVVGVAGFAAHLLPKSEYRLCEPPEVWTDVTIECVFMEKQEQIWHQLSHSSVVVLGHGATNLYEGYRLRKVPVCTGEGYKHEPTKQWAFIVEKKVSE